MHLEPLLDEQERRFGTPETLWIVQRIGADELAMVRGSTKARRTHDVTFFILDGPKVVVIKKPFFPPGAYRVPSGGVHPGEAFEAGVQREALEETGLSIRLDRYLLRVEACFVCGGERERWFTHVFSARAVEGALGARDTHEIAEVRWSTLEELQGPIRKVLLATQRGLFAYRVALTDKAVSLLDKFPPSSKLGRGMG
ncbi:MAG TPA: NUDIX hydrolase [Candidatus Bipolaricaulota bacterium]